MGGGLGQESPGLSIGYQTPTGVGGPFKFVVVLWRAPYVVVVEPKRQKGGEVSAPRFVLFLLGAGPVTASARGYVGVL